MVMKLTQKHIKMALDAGSCSFDYSAGQDVQGINQHELVWVDKILHKESVGVAKQIIKKNKGLNILGIPALSVLAFCGSGSGSGSGGYGEGYGDGYGYGTGSGGYGEGDGHGSGYGSGGYGEGYGDGSGDGYGGFDG